MTKTETYPDNTQAFKSDWIAYVLALQQSICKGLEECDGTASFITDDWEREEGKGGGGKTRTLTGGTVFEKAGVNTSTVFGAVSDKMKQQLGLEGVKWFACGLSLVLHPVNPYVPTVHANWRYFELYDKHDTIIDRWFGGGTDLTPYYLFEEDAQHFHSTLKNTLDPFSHAYYPLYKKQCDAYFVNSHRNRETRGIGGIFYDHLRPLDKAELENLFRFQRANGDAFLQSYLPIVARRRNLSYGEKEITWQEIRRGRYVEFNLLHDRGTIFGLQTNGRTESILMSLPPRARWQYEHHPEKGSPEDALLQVCLKPLDWI